MSLSRETASRTGVLAAGRSLQIPSWATDLGRDGCLVTPPLGVLGVLSSGAFLLITATASSRGTPRLGEAKIKGRGVNTCTADQLLLYRLSPCGSMLLQPPDRPTLQETFMRIISQPPSGLGLGCNWLTTKNTASCVATGMRIKPVTNYDRKAAQDQEKHP